MWCWDLSTSQDLCVCALGMKSYRYPTKAIIARMIEAARTSGLDVCGFEASPNGTVRIIEARAMPGSLNDFDRWEGQL